MTKVVILAGGRGSRLSEETDVRPKPMVRVGDEPILWHIMKIYASHGYTDFVICLGYLGYVIKEHFANYLLHRSDVTIDLSSGSLDFHTHHNDRWRVTLVNTGDVTNTGGRLKRVRHHLPADEPFLMTYGDGVADVDIRALVAFHRQHGRKATVTAVRPPGRFGNLAIKNNVVEAFAEKPDGDGQLINGGFFVLDPSVLDYIEGDETIWEREPMERLAREGDLHAYRHPGFWQCMDTLRDKLWLTELWESGHAPWKTWS
ncbi:glucose-1-phosphate cytidylyltransferase [Thalassobaculum fulvum]|uniref:Glucose-1-phosphate cytidylyltransferase n=1 Tax=Thalassobaculum fulvum TaxID=1633335 RepID=A0A918XRK2_9PROT|nr:glucose-1-phosphate cytidylyltransferase [Thalassobaculum fulvum]GHD49981.1 glucose-1-phosphate cytidylyltransferase [Thalassobaculum fulvum]